MLLYPFWIRVRWSGRDEGVPELWDFMSCDRLKSCISLTLCFYEFSVILKTMALGLNFF